MPVDRIKEVQKAIKKHREKKKKALARGLKKGALLIQRESQKIVPIDTSALKNSAGTTYAEIGNIQKATVFYAVAYGIYVHEDLTAKHKPGKEAKFLEKPFREKKDDVLRIIAQEVGET